MNRYLRTSLAASVAVTALVLVGCSSTKSEPTFSTDDADEMALRMIPEARVLPGTGWEVVSENDFSESDEDEWFFPEGNEHCDQVNETLSALSDFDDAEREGRATRVFEAVVQGADTVEVEITTEIYQSAARLRVAAQGYDRLMAGSTLGQCYVALFESSEDDVTTVEATDHVPTAVAPRRGWEVAVGSQTAGAEGEETMYFESYAWRIGNAIVTVTVSGSKERITEKFVSSVLQRVDGAAVVAAKES